VDIALIRWPDEDERRLVLASAGTPRLLVVGPAAAAPVIDDCLEDWVRLPAADEDVRARAAMLRQRAEVHAAARPVLEAGVMRFRGVSVALAPIESRLTAALLDRLGAVVSRDALAAAGWPSGSPGRNALDVHMLRLRRRLATTGLVIRTVRSRGYLLGAAGSIDMSDSCQKTVLDA
jgi:DNA-binding response OmpR family regulator